VGVAGAAAVRRPGAVRARAARPRPRRAGRGVRTPVARAVPRAAARHPRPYGRVPAGGHWRRPPAPSPPVDAPAPQGSVHRRGQRAARARLDGAGPGPAGGHRGGAVAARAVRGSRECAAGRGVAGRDARRADRGARGRGDRWLRVPPHPPHRIGPGTPGSGDPGSPGPCPPGGTAAPGRADTHRTLPQRAARAPA
jgi:hypothetical protein